MNRWRGALLVAALALACLSCSSYAILGRATRAGGAEAFESVKITRNGAGLAATPRMRLQEGDELETEQDVAALIDFRGGEAILLPKTRVRIVEIDPELFAWFGRLWLHGLFTTQTNYVTAASEGTEYLVELEQTTTALTITVIEGSVKVESRVGAWSSFVAKQRESISVTGRGPVTRKELSTDEYNQLLRELNALRLSPSFVVPEVRGLDLEAARSELRQQGLSISEVQAMPVESARIGRVVSQSPAPGARNFVVRLGLGSEAIVVPSLIGVPADAAISALDTARLKLGRTSERYSGQQRPGLITAQDPPAGRNALRDSAVDIVIEAQPSTVPKLVGEAEAGVRDRLSAVGLRLGQTTPELSETVAGAVVLRQNPPPQAQVAPNTKVDIVVARAAVRVPNLVGSKPAEAAARLRSLGLVLDGDPPPAPTPGHPLEASVGSQALSAGTLVPRGARVAVTYAVPSYCVVPDAKTMKSPAEIEAAFTKAHLKAVVSQEGSNGSTFTVVSQSVAAGTEILCSSSVRVDGVWVSDLK